MPTNRLLSWRSAAWVPDPTGAQRDRGAAGVVLAGSCALVAVGVVAELAEHPGAEDLTEPGLAAVDLSVGVATKMGVHLPLQRGDLGI